MEFPHGFEKGRRLAHNARRQKIRLRVERPRRQPTVFTFSHGALHVFLDDLEVFQQNRFKVVAPLRIVGDIPHLLQRQSKMALLNSFSERRRSSEVAMSRLFDVAHAQLMSAHRHHKIFDLLFFLPRSCA
jgi:hypothetical protein